MMPRKVLKQTSAGCWLPKQGFWVGNVPVEHEFSAEYIPCRDYRDIVYLKTWQTHQQLPPACLSPCSRLPVHIACAVVEPWLTLCPPQAVLQCWTPLSCCHWAWAWCAAPGMPCALWTLIHCSSAPRLKIIASPTRHVNIERCSVSVSLLAITSECH